MVSNDVQGEAIIYNLFSTMINYIIYLQKKEILKTTKQVQAIGSPETRVLFSWNSRV